VAVEEVLVPVLAVRFVDLLHVDAHVGGEELGEEEDEEAGFEGGAGEI